MFKSRLEPTVAHKDAVFDQIVAAIELETPIVYSKINHGFWERLVAIEALGFDIREMNPRIAKKMDSLEVFRRPTPNMFEGGFVREILDILNALPEATDAHIFSAGLLGWPGRLEVAGISHDEDICQDMIDRCIPTHAQFPGADGMEFKRAIINGSFVNYVDALRKRHCLLVGNHNLARYFEFTKCPQGQFLEIHETQARQRREAILQDIKIQLDRNLELKLVLLQAGGSLSAWLIHHLHRARPDVALIDIGLGSLICHPRKIFPTAFGRIYRRQLTECIESVHPGWIKKIEDTGLNKTVLTGRSDQTVELLKDRQVEPPSHFFDPLVSVVKPIPFDFPHQKDEVRLSQISQMSGSPRQLATLILKEIMGLPESDEIILCRSEAQAFEIAAAVYSKAGNGIVDWIMSALTDVKAALPIRKLDFHESDDFFQSVSAKTLPSQSGVIHHSNHNSLQAWNRLRHYCENSGTPLIAYNSDGLLDRPSTLRPNVEIEILACDLLKPWGAGDATLIILPRDHMKLAAALMTEDQKLMNQECYEFLDVLERYDRLAFFYQRQARRIKQLVSRHIPSLRIWPERGSMRSPVGFLRYLCDHPIDGVRLRNNFFEIRKNFPEVPSEFPVSRNIAERLISIPCHPFMRYVSNQDFIETLSAAIKPLDEDPE